MLKVIWMKLSHPFWLSRTPGLSRHVCLHACPAVFDRLRSTRQVSVFEDASIDGSARVLESWRAKFEAAGSRFSFHLSARSDEADPAERVTPAGPGYARNRAVAQACRFSPCSRPAHAFNLIPIVVTLLQCTAPYLCLLDADDLMLPDRIASQLYAAYVRVPLVSL